MRPGNHRAGLWLRGACAAGPGALCLLVLALPAVGSRTTPTSDPDTAAGAFVCLVGSAVFLAVTAVVARRWRSAWVLCLVDLGLMVVVWTKVPSPFVPPHVS
ncbi:hypothetical protein QFZ82_003296 [Streptomyces sp. V4I23]|uniref:hypothetical protein n=1 Tax=Streptomyces sp. V4I23 TaxID=3042282 RepID=UPI002782D9FC|nr:hypothetical protein [Streptomyces sp. V4I23]MDQ1008811.1 hypothetical protein [Streptomyces sp. V4I23]